MPLVDHDPVSFEASLSVNVVGTYLCMRSEIAAMRVRGRGAIVNISLGAGLQGVASLSAYCAAKHAVMGRTEAALDYAAANIRMNVVARLDCSGTYCPRAPQSHRAFCATPAPWAPEEVCVAVFR